MPNNFLFVLISKDETSLAFVSVSRGLEMNTKSCVINEEVYVLDDLCQACTVVVTV